MDTDETIFEIIPDREPTEEELMEMQNDRDEQILQDHRDDFIEEDLCDIN